VAEHLYSVGHSDIVYYHVIKSTSAVFGLLKITGGKHYSTS